MNIFDDWLIEFRALVAAEIDAAGGRAADGYRAVQSKTGIASDYVYQIYKGKPANTPKRPTADVMNTMRRVYKDNPANQPAPCGLFYVCTRLSRVCT